MPIGILAYIWLCDWQQWDLALSVINFCICLSFVPWVVNDLSMASLRPQFFATKSPPPVPDYIFKPAILCMAGFRYKGCVSGGNMFLTPVKLCDWSNASK